MQSFSENKTEIRDKKDALKNKYKYICERLFFLYIQILLPIIFEELGYGSFGKNYSR